MPAETTAEIDVLLTRLWSLLDLATATATAHDAPDHLEQVALLCDSAAATARAAALASS